MEGVFYLAHSVLIYIRLPGNQLKSIQLSALKLLRDLVHTMVDQ
nr:MAG TPA: hypothetical protein [Caudoviricetes sp.]